MNRIVHRERASAALRALRRLLGDEKEIADLLWEMVNALRAAKNK